MAISSLTDWARRKNALLLFPYPMQHGILFPVFLNRVGNDVPYVKTTIAGVCQRRYPLSFVTCRILIRFKSVEALCKMQRLSIRWFRNIWCL